MWGRRSMPTALPVKYLHPPDCGEQASFSDTCFPPTITLHLVHLYVESPGPMLVMLVAYGASMAV